MSFDGIRKRTDLEPSVYTLPDTTYFNGLKPTMSLRDLAVYAESERRGADLHHLLMRSLAVPLVGKLFYSPGGAAIVERAREMGITDAATSKWSRAVVVSPGTAVLGLGSVAEKNHVLQAGAAGPIMIGKAAYFAYCGGVNTEPITIETHFTVQDVVRLLEESGLITINGIENLVKFQEIFPKKENEDHLTWLNKLVIIPEDILDRLLATSDQHQPYKLQHIQSAFNNAVEKLRALKFVQTVANLANNYGFINVEDARGADLDLILGGLEAAGLGSAIWSDDKQGTGVITAAGVISWADQTGRLKEGPNRLEGIKVVILGQGAGATGVYNELVNNGVRPEDILITKVRTQEQKDTVTEFAKGADVFINLGVKETLTNDPVWTRNITKNLAPQALFSAMTNPDPGVKPENLHEVRSDIYYASGNQLYENVLNNFTAFSYIGLGALLAGATTINKEMTVAAALGIHKVAKMTQNYGQHNIVPAPTDIRLIAEEAAEVAIAAARSGVSIFLGANPTEEALRNFEAFVREEVTLRADKVLEMRENAYKNADDYYKSTHPTRYAPFYLKKGDTDPAYYVCPKIRTEDFVDMARRVALEEQRWEYLLEADKTLKRTALTTVLQALRDKADEGDDVIHAIAKKELILIVDVAYVSPALGLALALRRLRGWEHLDKLAKAPSVFHQQWVTDTVTEKIPNAKSDIEVFKQWVEGVMTKTSGPSGTPSTGGGQGTLPETTTGPVTASGTTARASATRASLALAPQATHQVMLRPTMQARTQGHLISPMSPITPMGTMRPMGLIKQSPMARLWR